MSDENYQDLSFPCQFELVCRWRLPCTLTFKFVFSLYSFVCLVPLFCITV